MNVQNKVIVITGGAGGIGSAQAKLLARNGAEVWILDLVQEKIDQLVEELKRQGGKGPRHRGGCHQRGGVEDHRRAQSSPRAGGWMWW